MMHNPNSFEAFPAGSAPLAVAGHTHGGQVRLPGTPEWSWLTFVKEDEVHADGWIDGYGSPHNRLYVNRGIGFSGVPLRINCMPEVSLFTPPSTMFALVLRRDSQKEMASREQMPPSLWTLLH